MKKTTIFISLFLIAFVLSACDKLEVRQSVYSDGSMVVKAEYDIYEFIKMSIESENEEIPDEYEDLNDYVLSTIEDSCEDYKKESEYDLELGLIFSDCSVNEEGKMIFYNIFIPGTIDIEKNDDIHTFSIINLVDYLDLPIPSEEDEYNENFEFQAGADKFNLESANLELDDELSPVSGDIELDIDIDFEFLFDGEIIHSDIGEVNDNKLVFNFEELFHYFNESSSPTVEVRVDEIQSVIDEYTINYKIEDANKVSLNVDLEENHNFFEKLKSNWQLDDSGLDKILNNDSSSFNISLNNDYYDHGDYYVYKLQKLITTMSEGSQLDFIKLKFLNSESKFNIVINFEKEILETDIGEVQDNKLILSSDDIVVINEDIEVKVAKNQDSITNIEEDIILISNSNCPHCENVKEFLENYKKEKKFTFIEYDISNDSETVKNIFNEYNIDENYLNVTPIIISDDQYFIGFNDEIKNNLISIINSLDPQPTPEPTPQPVPPQDIMKKTEIKNQAMHNNLKGRILLQVESAGEAYYVHPEKSEKYSLGRPDDAFSVMREQGVGISNDDLDKIPVSLDHLSGKDTSGDGLPDAFKVAMGLDVDSTDSDGDGYCDFTELTHGYDPLGPGKLNHDFDFAKNQAGRILLQVEDNGEAWYVNPENNKRYFLGRPNDAFSIMRNIGLGISNDNLERMIGENPAYNTHLEPMTPGAPIPFPVTNKNELLDDAIQLEISAEGWSPNEFTVNSGEIITLSVSAIDSFTHIFKFDDDILKAVQIGLAPGDTRAIEFRVPDAKGEYSFSCNAPDHARRGEVGVMIAE